MTGSERKELRRGWTTGACAAAAAKSSYQKLLSGEFADPVQITLPRGETPAFALAAEEVGEGWASSSIIKDAGDDPDVTHGALITSRLKLLPIGSGLLFKAGKGVGTVTKPGLPIPVGEPAINPRPREIIARELEEIAKTHNTPLDVEVEISIADGEKLAQKTMNPRLGILGGLSVLGTTGIVRPFSCAAWIASIHRGVDVARATGQQMVAAATGATSEDALKGVYPDLPESAYLDMGDFAGGLLKYLRAHPVPKLVLAGGPAKLVKLAQGAMDLHSARSGVDFQRLAQMLDCSSVSEEFHTQVSSANTVKQVLELCQDHEVTFGEYIALAAQKAALEILRGAPVNLEIFVIDRQGNRIGHAPFFP
ncbi:cobalt-precorrin-5B (C(1))-methyltransferase [Flexibacterium corallicola]|uniref:cobalt-precorrin-5B (C(1))-methyltransferase n=1 Tax=Flexibacterium corallicola TaxID=3037259 RepID=UPI00286F0CA6|nr:cobalt-precorrin-5B (C(1))-methyltransferase [Pseudovibrio sp. M1P-2-3]